MSKKALGREQKTEQPDFRGFTHPHQMDSERFAIAKPMIQSDKDNWVKSVIPQAFVMTAMDLISHVWAEIEKGPPFKCVMEWHKEAEAKYDDPEEFLGHSWDELYRVNTVAEGGRGRDDFRGIASAPFSYASLGGETLSKGTDIGARK